MAEKLRGISPGKSHSFRGRESGVPFNGLRLDEHLDLTGNDIYDASCWNKPGYLAADFRQQAQRETSGPMRACVPDGDVIEAFGKRIEGRGPWTYNLDGKETVEFKGVPRTVQVR
jgi:hypothetical protein